MLRCPFCHYDNEDGALFCEQYPSCDRNGADVYAFSEWLLQNQPDLLPANRGTFYQDLKAALHGLWQD